MAQTVFDLAQIRTDALNYKATFRTLIGAGTSNFDGAYSSLSGKPTLGTASAEDVGAFAAATHTHDDRYYTEAEVDAIIEALPTGDGHTHANKAILDAITSSFTIAQATKLSGIETGATADQTGSEIVALIDSQLGSTDWQTGGGADGADGVGVPAGGTTGQVLAKASNTNYHTQWVSFSGGDLNDVSFSDADTTLVAGQRLVCDLSLLTQNRAVSLPLGVAGQICEIVIITGSDSHELIVKGASNSQLNGMGDDTEWSRLFLANEFVRLLCVGEGIWQVVVDGRIPFSGSLSASSSAITISQTWTPILFDSSTGAGDHANDRIRIRRTCRGRAILRWFCGQGTLQTILAITKNGTSISPDTRIAQSSFYRSSAMETIGGGILVWDAPASLSAGDTLSSVVINSVNATAFSDERVRPLFTWEETLV